MEGPAPAKRKRTLPPEFCDASAAVSALTFGARRLPEVKALWSNLQQQKKPCKAETGLLSGGGKTSSRHLRRRATSHASRKRHRYPSAATTTQEPRQTTSSSGCRRERRRRKEHMQQTHEPWRCSITDQPAQDAAASKSETIHWMPTHLWHAKRFRMEALWGWKVPICHSNRGCRATARLVKEGRTLLQDVTWSMQPISLRFSNEAVWSFGLSLLPKVIPTFHTTQRLNNDMGEGMLHEEGSFPAGAIGPVRWILADKAVFGEKLSAFRHLYVWMHPSIRVSVDHVLRRLLSHKGVEVSDGLEGGVACFRLYGTGIFRCLKDAYSGSMLDSLTEEEALNVLVNKKVLQIHSTSNNSQDRPPPKVTLCFQSDRLLAGERRLRVIDAFCDPSLAMTLLLSLVMRSSACPIGVQDEYHLSLEVSPPPAIFPRDHPDTEEGVHFWTASSNDWARLRAILENTSDNRLQKVSWPFFLPERQGTSTVVVRGLHGEPFLKVLQDAAGLSRPVVSVPHQRRKRRKTNRLVQSAPLERNERELHQKFCHSLSQSLSLPALLRCHVSIEEKGRLQSGDLLFGLDDFEHPIGCVTAGTFSLCNGSFQGVAVCGAFHFLRLVSHGEENSSIVIQKFSDRPSEARLRVECGASKQASTRYRCTLTPIFQ